MWQDEGFNTFINYFSEARRYPGEGRRTTSAVAQRPRAGRAVHAAQRRRAARDQPGPHQSAAARRERVREDRASGSRCCATRSSDRRRSTTRSASTRAAGRSSIRRRRTSSRPWRTSSGKRLDWFFREWFLENPHFDQAIDTVVTEAGRRRRLRRGAATATTRAACCRSARASRSATARQQDFNYPAEVWSTNTTHLRSARTSSTGKKLDEDRARSRQAPARHRPREQRLAERGNGDASQTLAAK